MRSVIYLLVVVGFVVVSGCAKESAKPSGFAERSQSEAETQKVQNEPNGRGAPLFEGMGTYHRQITTHSKLAQRYFDQGMVLTYAFNHAEAVRSFEEAGRLDPQCAMAFWGVALALGPNINAPMEADAYAKAYATVKRAQELAPNASPVERDFIAALSKRYGPEKVDDRAPLDKAYSEAMRELAEMHPNDLDAQTLYAESVMDTTPWNYWTPDLQPRPGTAEVIAALESVMEQDPGHPGANHLYIHAVEAGPTPETALPAADRLRDLVPGAGHLVHMPSHIYLRIGKYAEASWANEQAIHADDSYLDQCAAQGFYPALYYPHNVHFLWYSASMEGRSAASMDAAKKAAAFQDEVCCGPEGPRQRPLPMLAAIRFGKWDEVLDFSKPTDAHPFDMAAWHYARGIALAMKNQPDDAAKELAALRAISSSEQSKALDTPYLPGTQVLAAMTHELAGEIAIRQGRTDEGLAELARAVEVQDALPYTEPPFYHYSIRHVQGAALLDANRPAEAEAVYREDLKRHPSNGWALFGLKQSLAAQGKTAQAEEVGREFAQQWLRADVTLTSSRY